MPRFDTPTPITVDVELAAGDVRLHAGERTDTIVTVTPSDPGQRSDVSAAHDTHVECVGGRLAVRGPKTWRRLTPFGAGGSVDVVIELPVGSDVGGRLTFGQLVATGQLGACRLSAGAGDIRVERAGEIDLSTGAGDIAVELATGGRIGTGSGDVRLAAISGITVIKSSNGDSHVGEADGRLEMKGANSSFTVDRARGQITAKTSLGDIRLGDVTGGTVDAQTGCGSVEVAIGRGVAAWLDLHTKFGVVSNELVDTAPPDSSEGSVEVIARTRIGDITIRRASDVRLVQALGWR
jgi:hypothetical protein